MTPRKLSIPEIILAILFGGMIVVMALGVFFRYVLNNSLSWNIELARYIFTWATFLGAVIALRDGVHIRIDLLIDRVPPKIRTILDIFNHVLVLIFSLTIVWLGIEFVQRTSGKISPALSLPTNYVYHAALPVTFVLGVYYAAKKVLQDIRSHKNASRKEESV